MNALGYALKPMIVDTADHGTPQHRERLFIVAAHAAHPLMIRLERCPHVPASSFIDFGAGNWQPIEKPGRAAATLRRLQAGCCTHGDRFVMPRYGGGLGLTGRCLSRSLGTVTTRDRWGVVDSDRMRMLTVQECRAAMGSLTPTSCLPNTPTQCTCSATQCARRRRATSSLRCWKALESPKRIAHCSLPVFSREWRWSRVAPC